MSPQLFSTYACIVNIMREVNEEHSTSEYDYRLEEPLYRSVICGLHCLILYSPEGLDNVIQCGESTPSYLPTCNKCFQNKHHGLHKMAKQNTNIVIDSIHVEQVQSFQCLGEMLTTNGDRASNIKRRLAMAVQALNNMQ